MSGGCWWEGEKRVGWERGTYRVRLGKASRGRPSSSRVVSCACYVGGVGEDVLCGPCATAAPGDVGEVGDDEGAVVGGFTLDTDAFSAGAVGIEVGCCVDAHIDLVVLCL
jgi:hypothetical protein